MATAISGEALRHHLLSDRFRPLSHIVWVRQADVIVLLDGERGLYYTLNEVAARLWELLAAGEPIIEILRCIREDFEVSGETLELDLAALLKRLLEAELIERSGHEA